MTPGHVYVLINRAMPGLVKVGMTGRTPAARARELSGTALPHPFEVAHSVEVGDRRAVEAALHRRLAPYRVRRGREFFRLGADEARRIVDEEADRFRRRRGSLAVLAAVLSAAVASGAAWFALSQGLDVHEAAGTAALAGVVSLAACFSCGPAGPRRARRRHGRGRRG